MIDWNAPRTRKTVLTVGLGLAMLDTVAGGIEASNDTGTDLAIVGGAFLLYAVAAAAVWARPTVGRFLASWAFLFNVLLGVPLLVDFALNAGGGAQAVEVVRSMVMSGLFLTYAWGWRPGVQ